MPFPAHEQINYLAALGLACHFKVATKKGRKDYLLHQHQTRSAPSTRGAGPEACTGWFRHPRINGICISHGLFGKVWEKNGPDIYSRGFDFACYVQLGGGGGLLVSKACVEAKPRSSLGSILQW